jgi:hypothetical protein
MEKLHPVDWLETLESHFLVDSLKLNAFAILSKLYFPFLVVARVTLGVRTPVCHTKTRVSEACISSEHNHSEDTVINNQPPTILYLPSFTN